MAKQKWDVSEFCLDMTGIAHDFKCVYQSASGTWRIFRCTQCKETYEEDSSG